MPNPHPKLDNLTNMGKGRPSLNKVRLNARVLPKTKDWLESQPFPIGDCIDLLVEKMQFQPTHFISLESGELIAVQAFRDGTDGLLLFTKEEMLGSESEPEWQTDYQGLLMRFYQYFEGAKLIKL